MKTESKPKVMIVCGPESSGHHLVNLIFLESGFSGFERIGKELPEDFFDKTYEKFVYTGSVPKGRIKNWDWLFDTVYEFTSHGYEAFLVVLVREPFAVSHSQVQRHKPEVISEAFECVMHAYRVIFQCINEYDLSYCMLTYESLVYQKEATLNNLGVLIGCALSTKIEITNENSKHNALLGD